MTKFYFYLFPIQALQWLRINGWKVILVLASALFIYWPALNGSWIADDVFLLANNPMLHGFGGLRYIWFGYYPDNEWPLTWSLAWIMTQLFGSTPLAFHLLNLGLHLISAFLFWSILARLGLRQSWLGAFIFVVHPITVQSVAWMSEIKNDLSLPFYLLAMHAWLDFVEEKGRFRYALTFILYLAAMLSKSSTVMLPCVLLLLGWWKANRLVRLDFVRIVPFLCVAILLGILSIHNQDSALDDPSIKARTLLDRIGQSGGAAFFYLGKYLWPMLNMPIYSKWQVEPPSVWSFLKVALLGSGFLLLLIFRRQHWARNNILGFGFFFLNIAPVLGMANPILYYVTWVADYLAYLPCLGLIGLSLAGYELAQTRGFYLRSFAVTGLSLGILCCLIISHNYASKFQSNIMLWNYALKMDPRSLSVRRIHANILLGVGNYARSIQEFRSLLKEFPDDDETQWRLAEALDHVPSEKSDAKALYSKLQFKSGLSSIDHNKLGIYLMKQGRTKEAIEQFQIAISMRPMDVRPYGDFGFALMQEPHRQNEAIAVYEDALKIDSIDPIIHNNLGLAYATIPGRLNDAISELQLAITYSPNFVEAHNNLGNVWERKENWDRAAAEYKQAIKLNPNDPKAYEGLAFIYAKVFHQWAKAVDVCQTLVQIQPERSASHTLLGNALAYAGRDFEACQAYEEALRIDPNDEGAIHNLPIVRKRMSQY